MRRPESVSSQTLRSNPPWGQSNSLTHGWRKPWRNTKRRPAGNRGRKIICETLHFFLARCHTLHHIAHVMRTHTPTGAGDSAARSITITRESSEIFTAESNFGFWGDSSHLRERLSFDDGGNLSAVKAQTIDRAQGLKYILISPISFRKDGKYAPIIAAAVGLQVGESANVPVNHV